MWACWQDRNIDMRHHHTAVASSFHHTSDKRSITPDMMNYSRWLSTRLIDTAALSCWCGNFPPRLDTSDMMRVNCSKISIPAYWSALFPDTARFNADVGCFHPHRWKKSIVSFHVLRRLIGWGLSLDLLLAIIAILTSEPHSPILPHFDVNIHASFFLPHR